MPRAVREILQVPGTRETLVYERGEGGRLVGLYCRKQTYVEEQNGRRLLGDNLASIAEARTPRALLRHVRAYGRSWIEKYIWDESARLSEVDGVRIIRDERNRVTACVERESEWRYVYSGDYLLRIEGAGCIRELVPGPDGRPAKVQVDGCTREILYGPTGRRLDAPSIPGCWNRDELGRLWTVTGPDGRIVTTYLWDGFACIGRIDGPPGAPLAAVFSLDPSGTPVRVITPGGVTRFPRDAFGEGLLLGDGVPGLYGGAIHGGFVHFRSRALDPRLGAFDRPDPWHGDVGDPRRLAGYRGPLWVETADSRYCVCQNDPIGRSDPTGEVSASTFLTPLSQLTWSMPNTVLDLFGLDLTINFWGSLLSFNADNYLERFFGLSFHTGQRQQTLVVRRDGFAKIFLPPGQPDRALTYHFTLWSKKEELEELDIGRVVDPKGQFLPTMYGSLLLAEPQRGRPIALTGAGNLTGGNNLLGWTRAGGFGMPTFPGSETPRFPCGGVHFDSSQTDHESEQRCSIAELEPSGGFAAGTLTERARAVVPRVGLGLAGGAFVLLTDAQNRAVILELDVVQEVAGTTHIWLESDPAGIDRAGLRLRSLVTPPSSTEDVPRVATEATHLDLAGSAPTGPPPNYERGDPARFLDPSAPATVLGVGFIRTFEASITLDADLPAGLTPPIRVRRATPGTGGSATLTADPNVLEFGTGPAPGQGEPILVTLGGSSIAVVVTGVTGTQRRVDRAVNAALGGSPGDTVSWQRLAAAGADLGERASPLSAGALSTLVYEAQNERTAPPAADHVLVEDSASQLHARTVSSVNYDALVFETAIPAGPATVRVERFQFTVAGSPGHVDETGVALQSFLSIAVDPPQALTGKVFQLIELGAPPPLAAGPTTAFSFTALSGAVASGALPATPSANPFPSQFVVLNQAGAPAPEAAVVRRVRLRMTLDRVPSPSIDGATNLELVRLNAGGPAYSAQAVAPTRVTVLPDVGGTAVQMPRFRPGHLVRANGTGLGADQVYRVEAVERHGTTLTLADGPGLPTPLPTSLTLSLLDIVDPGNGGSRHGIRGTARVVAGAAQVTFDVWAMNTLSAGQTVGVISGDRTLPALIDTVDQTEVEFASPPALTPTAGSPVDVTIPAVSAAGFSTAFRQESNNAIVIIDDDPPPLAATTNLVVVVAFDEAGIKADGELSAGTTLVPEDPENFELERRQSLIDHEIRHTEQCAIWGPLLLCWSPLLAFQIPVELTTEIELPKFSAYVDGLIFDDERKGRFLRIPDFHSVPFAKGDIVQVSQSLVGDGVSATLGPQDSEHVFRLVGSPGISGGLVLVLKQGEERYVAGVLRHGEGATLLEIPDFQEISFSSGDSVEIRAAGPAEAVKLGDKLDDTTFALADGAGLPVGNVRIRRAKSGTEGWNTFFDIMHFMTHGGLTSFLVGLIWGGVIWSVGKLGYFVGRKLFVSDPTHAATVSKDRLQLALAAAEVPENLRGVTRVTVHSGESTVVRSTTEITGPTIELTSAIEFSGEVRVSPYKTRNVIDDWDWHSYYPARVADPTKPAAISIERVNGDSLSLDPFDRVRVTAGDQSRTKITRVTSVNADGTVELEEAPPTSGAERLLRIAHLSVDDPLAPADSVFLRLTNIPLMRWFFDPWGQIHYRTAPERGSFWDWVARVARWAFGTRSWSLLPLPGWFFWDNLFKQIPDEGHLAQMEQDASEESGDLYAPMSRLRPNEDALRVVGDVGRFWFFPWGADRRTTTVISADLRDAPGLPYNVMAMPRLLPSYTNTYVRLDTSGNPILDAAGNPVRVDPNRQAEAPAGTGGELPDIFVLKDATAPLEPTDSLDSAAPIPPDNSFRPSAPGFIPTSAKLERAIGAYVAFTRPQQPANAAANRPGRHRVTVPNNIFQATDAREAHDGGTSFFFIPVRQPIFFDVEVRDVTVEIAGRRVGEGDTVRIVQTQRASVTVTPKDGRRYVVTLLRPETGGLLRREGDDLVVGRSQNGDEPVEIGRFYGFTPNPSASACELGGSFDGSRLNEHGMHLAQDVHIPVRQLRIELVDTLSVRSVIPSQVALQGDLNLDDSSITEIRPGEHGFVLVPTAILLLLRVASITYSASPTPPPTDPSLDIDEESVSPDRRAFIGDGGIFKVALSADDPPEEEATANLSVDVGVSGNSATIRATIALLPHFRLERSSPPGGANFQVARGASITLRCSDGVSAGGVVVTPSAGITTAVAGSDVTITVAASAATGPHRVLVSDAADANRKARRTIEVTP